MRLSALRKHLSPALVLAFIALVFAVTGGAFAASSPGGAPDAKASAATSAPKKKAPPKGKRGPRGPAGPKGATGATGPAGPAGPAGPGGAAGAKGETGAAGATGATGTAGTNGESVTNTTLAKGNATCKEGGAEFKVGTTTTHACNGATGFTETLPKGKTETGVWAAEFSRVTEGNENEPISFAIPLETALGEAAWHYVTTQEQENNTAPEQCPGDAESPEAAKGNLCIYEGFHEEVAGAQEPITVTQVNPPTTISEEGTGTSGAVLYIGYQGSAAEPALLSGSWAVTAP
jgi:hypothetical protein